jgi:hypothetical protein
MAQGDRSPTEINRNDSFDNTALFSDRVTSRAEVGNLVDRSFEGKLNAFVYPEDLRGTDFARRGGQVMVFKIFTRKSQKIDLTQSLKDAGSVAVEVGEFAAKEIGSVVGIGEGYTDLDQNTNRAVERLVGSDQVRAARQSNDIITGRDAIQASYRQSSEQARFGAASEELNDQVIMYVPKGIVIDNSVEYEDTSMAGLSALTQAIASGFNNASALTTTLGLQALKMAGSVTKNIGVDIEGGLKARAGFATNPKNELNFKGPTRNDFSFEFEFAPRSAKEAQTATEIIDIFRYYMSPEISLSSTVYFSPQEFDISIVNLLSEKTSTGGESFSSVENTSIPKIGRCYLKNVKVDYTPDDRSAFFQNGQPVRAIMSLTFNQINYITKQGILAGF